MTKGTKERHHAMCAFALLYGIIGGFAATVISAAIAVPLLLYLGQIGLCGLCGLYSVVGGCAIGALHGVFSTHQQIALREVS